MSEDGARRALGRALSLAASVVIVQLALLGLLPGRSARAQVPLLTALSAEQNPRGLTWWRLDTPHFIVIHPDSLAREAQRAATLLERAYEPLARSFQRKPERIPVVLNNSSMISNAFVAWGPRRSEWYAAPNTTVDLMGPVEWYSLLALHEGRHIAQERAVRTGIVGVLSRLFGDNTTAFFGGALYFPAWFWEGDAVGMETALSAAGRGRQPSFTQRVRALAHQGAPYPFRPAWQGSYRTYYPDWYELGYLLTSHVRRVYGDSAWRRVIGRAARNPIAPIALDRALRRETGRSLVQLHGDAIRAIDSTWQAQRAATIETPATVHALSGADYHEFTLPQYAGDGSLIALYSDLATIKRLVRIRDGRVEVLRKGVGLFGELQFHVHGATVAWSEYELSPRWGEESFLVVKVLDLRTGTVRRLTDRSRYYGAAVAPDEQHLAAIDFSRSRQSTLVVLDLATGAERQRLPNPEGHTLLTPAWAPDGNSVYVVALHAWRGNALVRVPLDGSPADTLVPFTHEAISRPVAHGDHVYFGSPRSGLDNIHAVHLATRQVWQVTARPLGAMWPSVSPDGRRLAFSDYGARGYSVAEMALDPATFRAPAAAPLRFTPLVRALEAQEGAAALLQAPPPDTTWPSRPFTGWPRLFDFHSLVLSPTSDGVNVGAQLESRNLLNTVGFAAGATFNVNERATAVEAGVSYAGLPVIVDVAVRGGRRASTYTDSAGTVQGYGWKERAVTSSLRLPLTRLDGQVRQSLLAVATVGRTGISEQPVAFRFDNGNGDFTTATYLLSASQVRSAAYRDLYPVGATLTAAYRHTPGSSDYTAHQGGVVAAAYLPGAWRHHALVLDAAREEQRPGNYRFSSLVRFARGFDARFHESLTRVGATYHAPLLYPDLALGNWLYVRRVQGNVFADAVRGRDGDGSRRVDYRSVGSELTADLSPLGLRTTIRAGVRVSMRLTGERRTVTEAVVVF